MKYMAGLKTIALMGALSSFLLASLPTFGAEKKFYQDFTTEVQETCNTLQNASSAQYQAWLISELQKIGVKDWKIEKNKIDTWQTKNVDFKVSGESFDGRPHERSPGTFGTINKTQLKFANDSSGHALTADVIDGGKGSSGELAKLQLEKKIILVERSALVPEITALALEARARKASGLIVYEKNTFFSRPKGWTSAVTTREPLCLPVFDVNEDTATRIQTQLKHGAVSVSLTAETDFPVTEEQTRISVRRGDRDPVVVVAAQANDCLKVSMALGLLDRLGRSKQGARGTAFTFFAGNGTVDDGGVNDGAKIASGMSKNLKGMVDGDDLHLVAATLSQLQKSKMVDLRTLKIQKIFESYGDSLLGAASDIKSLQEVYGLVQRGRWEQANTAATKIRDFIWAQNVSPETFLEYRKRLGDADRVDPNVWFQLQKSRKETDGLLEVLEREIDRLSARLTENFSRLKNDLQVVQTSLL